MPELEPTDPIDVMALQDERPFLMRLQGSKNVDNIVAMLEAEGFEVKTIRDEWLVVRERPKDS